MSNSATPFYIQKAVDLGVLEMQDGKIVGCKKEEIETVLGITRIIEKIQPTTVAETESTVDQETIVLSRVLSAPSGKSRELWSDLRIAVGVGHGQSVPENLWSTPALKAVGGEIDRIFLGDRNVTVISRESLISQYEQLNNASRTVGFQEFAQTVSELSDPQTLQNYGDAKSEWTVALDLLRQCRVRALYKETLHMANQVIRSDSKLEKNIEFLQHRAMECIGMLRGSIGNQGMASDLMDEVFGLDGRPGFIDEIMNATPQKEPLSTGIASIDMDIDGGIKPASGGRLFTLAARTGIGKTVLGVHIATSLALKGLAVGFLSAELGKKEIMARILASLTRKTSGSGPAATVLEILSPDFRKEEVSNLIAQAMAKIQESGGKLLVEAPWGACVDSVVNSMRMMKAKNPELKVVVLDHFHCLARHKGASSNEAAMMEDRAYKLMTAAKELDIDLFVLAQMNRVGMDAVSKNAPPQLNEIRGTDALSHVSHAVWIIRKHIEPEGTSTGKRLEIWHAKNRGGQGYWSESEQRMRPVAHFVESGILEMDYSYSSVARDDSAIMARKGIVESRTP